MSGTRRVDLAVMQMAEDKASAAVDQDAMLCTSGCLLAKVLPRPANK